MKLYNFRWTLAEDDTQDMILWKEKLWVIELWKMVQKIHQKKRKMSQIDTQTIQDQVDFYDLESIIKDKVQEEKCSKTEIEHNFLKDVREILQCNQFKYEITLCISSEEKKIIHKKYITLNNKYIFSEFYAQTRQL